MIFSSSVVYLLLQDALSKCLSTDTILGMKGIEGTDSHDIAA
jgi:hypothetical protein